MTIKGVRLELMCISYKTVLKRHGCFKSRNLKHLQHENSLLGKMGLRVFFCVIFLHLYSKHMCRRQMDRQRYGNRKLENRVWEKRKEKRIALLLTQLQFTALDCPLNKTKRMWVTHSHEHENKDGYACAHTNTHTHTHMHNSFCLWVTVQVWK